ncbi:hypothetical protein [Granulicella sibirica]|uniref:Uncharacterized protein n=1 Tax=Granulicella sibirica TaxID=2479048 RepID=A0A4Q0SUY5_9BACT|nr:hypothetical protein [Granulicella sibirica]RXH54142.1 hypothetical protein GRAN_4793 [Granulicella sibirica]
MHSLSRHGLGHKFMAALFLLILFLVPELQAQEMVVGVNVVNPLRASLADQNTLLGQLKAAQVHVIRCGISNDDKGIDFAKRAAAAGMHIQLIIGPEYAPGSPSRAYDPAKFPSMWGGHPLSSADPELSKTAFQHLFESLDTNGIALAGVELGNEINWAAFNPEFPLPGEGKILSLDDLTHNPEGKLIAKGFLRYIEILTALKEVRDHSRVNKNTPIISAGMVGAEDGAKLYNDKKEDMVSLSATIAFLRVHGLDSLVDAYGIHSYPSSTQPGNAVAKAQRLGRLNSVDLAECRAKGAKDGKPCWITEWGFPNSDLSCPAKEANRTLLVEELRGDFAVAVAQHRLAGIDYFSWDSDPWSKTTDADSVYRCGALTESGQQAVAPEGREKTADLGSSMKVRVGTPLVARGPAPNIADAAFTEIQLPDGLFRGFTAAGTTFAIDGKHPYEMEGKAATVLKAGPPGTSDSCGQWINHVELQGKTLYGWVHNETACNYANGGQTHMMMTIGTSTDYGLTWKILGPIIRGTDPPAARKETGDSCIIAIRAPDAYDYSYCLHNGGHSWDGGYTFIARAPVADPGPGKWKKYYNGSWSEPGVDGKSSAINGTGSGWWTTTGEIIGTNWVKGGMGLVASTDRLHFAPVLSQPLMLLEPGDWSRKNGLELVSYAQLIDARTGLNQLGDHWLLTYMYLNPGENFSKRYLVFRPVDISWSRTLGEPQVGEMLTHWYDKSQHDHWATTAPVPGNWAAYAMVAPLGYMMTAPPDSKQASAELEECVSQGSGHLDHILIQKGICESKGYTRLRSAGFVFSAEQPNTQPLYRCYSDSEKSHFAANQEDCNGMGKNEALLGYDLKQ